jgi:hypothetical protein
MLDVADSVLEFEEVSNELLFSDFDETKLPSDFGPIVQPTIEASYAAYRPLINKSALDFDDALMSSLVSMQSHALRQADLTLNQEIEPAMTENVAKCLLNGECALQTVVNRYDQATQLLRQKRDGLVFGVISLLGEMAKQFEYWSLSPQGQLQLGESPSTLSIREIFTEFSQKSYLELSERGGQPTEALVSYTVTSDTHQKLFASLQDGGHGPVLIPRPRNSKYRDVRVSGHDVRVYAFPSVAEETDMSVHVTVTKGAYSTFFPINAEEPPLTFLHPSIASSRVYNFVYNPATCTDISRPCTSAACEKAEFLSVSPYGEWSVKLGDAARRILTSATALRMTFKVTYYSSTDLTGLGGAEQGDSMFANDTCAMGPTCFSWIGATQLVTDEECLPPTTTATTKTEESTDETESPTTTTVSDTALGDDSSASGSKSDEGDGSGTMLTIIIALVVLLLAVIIIAVVLSMRSRRDNENYRAEKPAEYENDRSARVGVSNPAYVHEHAPKHTAGDYLDVDSVPNAPQHSEDMQGANDTSTNDTPPVADEVFDNWDGPQDEGMDI